MTKLRHCPNCKQNVVPALQSRQGAGCVSFLACLLMGCLMVLVDAEPPILVVLCTGWWMAGFVMLLVLGHGKRICPKCGMPNSQMGKAL